MTEDPKYTPGPWLANIGGPYVLGGDGTTIDAVTPDGKEVRREICNLLLDTGDGDDPNPDLEEDLANARLIAASPDLLEAARYCLDMLSQRAGDETLGEKIGAMGGYRAAKLLGDAIAKAIGSSPN